MLRKFLSILLILLLAALPALAADAPIFSEDVQCLQRANAALVERYGLTVPTLGLFQAQVSRCGDTAIVTYSSNSGVDDSLAGTYFVILTPNSAQALWTHDGVDPTLWQSGDLTSPAWGVKQLTAYLAEHPYRRGDFCTPYVQTFTPFEMDAFLAADGTFEDLSNANRVAAQIARDRALAAVQAMYSLTDEEVSRLSWVIDTIRLYRYPDGHEEWQVTLAEADVLDSPAYYVTLDAQTGLILRISISTGGVG